MKSLFIKKLIEHHLQYFDIDVSEACKIYIFYSLCQVNHTTKDFLQIFSQFFSIRGSIGEEIKSLGMKGPPLFEISAIAKGYVFLFVNF